MNRNLKLYVSEFELSYTLPASQFLSHTYLPLSRSGRFRYLSELHITQKWLSETPTSRSRIRLTEQKNPYSAPLYTHTTKYFSSSQTTIRTEVNAALTKAEYDFISSLYPDLPTTKKTRILFEDTESHLTYAMDIYPKTDPQCHSVTLEIEFKSKSEKDNFKPPEWLLEAQKEGVKPLKKEGKNGSK